jgi:tetratricopeptide (TPR) repeat protein
MRINWVITLIAASAMRGAVAQSAGESAAPGAGCVEPSQLNWDDLVAKGRSLRDQSRYADAEHCLHSGVTLAETFGSADPHYAESLNALATVVQIRGWYDEAQILFEQALVIWRRHPGEHHLNLAVGLSNLANLLRVKGQYLEAERLQLQAIEIERAALSPANPILLETLYGLGAVQASAGRYTDAEVTFRRVLATQHKVLGADHPAVAKTSSDLGHVYYILGRYPEAEPLYRRAIAIREKVYGPEDVEVGLTLTARV